MARQTLTLSNSVNSHPPTPPPNFSVPLTNLSLRPSTTFFHAHFFPSDPKRLIFVSSDQTTLFQSSTVQSLCPSAKSSLAFLCLALSNGFFFFTTAFIPAFFRYLLVVSADTG